VAQVTITDDRLVIRLDSANRLWAFRSTLEVPLDHVSGVDVDRDAARLPWSGLPIREPGGWLPGMITAGDVRHDGDWVFWDVTDPDRAIVIRLADERYARLVVEVDDPEATAAAITRALRRRAATGRTIVQDGDRGHA
jgi:hypothetical protein